MKTHKDEREFEGEDRRAFMRALLDDVQALERMLAEGRFETGVRRIGAEQEMFLTDPAWRPAPAALRLLDKLQDPAFVTELGLFNLELNLEARTFTGTCLGEMERELDRRLAQAREAAAALGVEIVLAGILPTIRKSDLGLDNMVPKPRYQALNRAFLKLRGGDYEIHLKGLDEIHLRHDSVMVEACNTSFQVHLQVEPAEFANLYNIAQVVAAPLLAVACNSPLLFGKRLWAETRIALFQQSVDTRTAGTDLREQTPRVTFGNRWVRESVLELFRDDIARFRTLVGAELEEDPFARLDRGEVPELAALRLHNGTVYRWNRACYGITGGKPHLRIECRALPAGPSVADEIANAAFWLGLMTALPARHEDITRVIDFEHAQLNFTNAARQGLGAHFTWLEGEELPARTLILDRLLPLAEQGLDRAGIDAGDRRRLLGVVEERARGGLTGSRWLLQSLGGMKDHGTVGERLHALTAAIAARQKRGDPVARWQPATLAEGGGWQSNYLKVEQYMVTDFATVHEDDPVELVANLMQWQRVRHVPVEDGEHRLRGLVSHRHLLRLFTQGRGGAAREVPVGEIMKRDPVTVSPDTATSEAIALLRENAISILPVVRFGILVGVVTEAEFLGIALELLEERLRREEPR